MCEGDELDAKDASLQALEPELSKASDLGRMVGHVLGMVAGMELNIIRDRQRVGLDAAKERGVYRGRRKQVDDVQIRSLAASRLSKTQIARYLDVSRVTIYRALDAPLRPRNAGDPKVVDNKIEGHSRKEK